MQNPTDNAGDSATSPDSPVETVAIQLLGEGVGVGQTTSSTLAPDSEGGVRVRTTVAGPGTVRYALDAPEDAVVTVAADRSVAVVGTDGRLLAGLARPVVTGADGTEQRAVWAVSAGETLAVDLDPASGSADRAKALAYPLTIDVYVGRAVVAGVEWGDREGGRSLAVTPTSWGRASGLTGRTYGFADVVRLEPSADTTVMKNQFLCHVDGAPKKDTWNLEPWRPDISFVSYLLARCNPT